MNQALKATHIFADFRNNPPIIRVIKSVLLAFHFYYLPNDIVYTRFSHQRCFHALDFMEIIVKQ